MHFSFPITKHTFQFAYRNTLWLGGYKASLVRSTNEVGHLLSELSQNWSQNFRYQILLSKFSSKRSDCKIPNSDIISETIPTLDDQPHYWYLYIMITYNFWKWYVEKKLTKSFRSFQSNVYMYCIVHTYSRWHIFNALTENETSMQQEKLRQNGECGPYAYCTCMRCVTTVTW